MIVFLIKYVQDHNSNVHTLAMCLAFWPGHLCYGSSEESDQTVCMLRIALAFVARLCSLIRSQMSK